MAPKRKVLIVEDESIVQLHLKELLQELGYVVSGTASTGAEALRSAAADEPHLVLMDIKLAGGRDGIDTAREMRDQFDPALVFLTAFGDDLTLARAQEVGANGYIVKPFSKPQMRATLTTAMAEHQRMRAVRDSREALASVASRPGEGLVVTDVDGFVSFLDSHASALTGWSQSEALERHVLDVIVARGEPAKELAAMVQQTRASNGGLELELQSRRGPVRSVCCEAKPLTDTDGTRRGLVLVLSSVCAEPPVFAAPRERRPFGAGTRMAIFSHDTLGLGHLQRCTNIARGLTAHYPGLSVLLLTGSPAVHRYQLPQGVDYIKLPAVRKVGSEQYAARTLGLSGEGVQRLRSDLILHSIQGFAPDVLLVDHAPLGMKGELATTLDWLREQRPSCIKLLGLRDILDSPEHVKKTWNEQDTYEMLRRHYDRILVYGSREVFDPTAAYGFPPELVEKTVFCHYVQEFQPEDVPAEEVQIDSGGKPLVVVTIGGGDGGETLLANYLEMLSRFRDQVNFESILLTGPFLPAELQKRFIEEAQGLPARVLDFVTSTSPYLARADLVLSTCGYNTMTQTLSHGRKALVVPRVMHREEQLLRARRLAELGLIECMPPDEVTPEKLFTAVRAHLADPRAPLAEARASKRIPLDGIERIAELCGGLIVG